MILLKQANGNIIRSEEEKEQMIKEGTIHYGNFLTSMGYDWRADPNSDNTPYRYAKSFVQDLIAGSINESPIIKAFPNTNRYSGMVCQTNITVRSLCSHHHREIYGKAHVAYIPGETGLVIGLSKLNKIVFHYSQRFQLQEDLTKQIHDHINEVCEDNLGVAVLIQATHGCVRCRSTKDDSEMITCQLTKAFLDNNDRSRDEFYRIIELVKK